MAKKRLDFRDMFILRSSRECFNVHHFCFFCFIWHCFVVKIWNFETKFKTFRCFHFGRRPECNVVKCNIVETCKRLFTSKKFTSHISFHITKYKIHSTAICIRQMTLATIAPRLNGRYHYFVPWEKACICNYKQGRSYRQCHRCVAPRPPSPNNFQGPPTDVHQTFFLITRYHTSMNFRLRFCIETNSTSIIHAGFNKLSQIDHISR